MSTKRKKVNVYNKMNTTQAKRKSKFVTRSLSQSDQMHICQINLKMMINSKQPIKYLMFSNGWSLIMFNNRFLMKLKQKMNKFYKAHYKNLRLKLLYINKQSN